MSLQRILPTTGPSSLSPTGFAETILIITILLGVLCVIALVLRTWQRVRDRNFHVDDGVTWLGLMFNLLQYGFVAWGTTVGIGSPDSMLAKPMMTSASQASYWIEVTYTLAMGFTKCSICSTLLRINKGTGHRNTAWALWLIMIAVAAALMATFLYLVTRCDPISGCRDSSDTGVVLYLAQAGIYILVDIALAAIPLFMIRGLNMQKSLKLSLGVILAMGGIACLASILRIPARLDNKDGAEGGYKFGSVILWSVVETGLSIIACCLPMMRKLLRSFDTDDASVVPGRAAYYQPGSSGHSGRTPSNNNGRLPHQSSLSSDQEKGPNTV
ncbi:p-type atpase [Diaporthe eres]|nr:p-type atpase [Diaporthe eres]